VLTAGHPPNECQSQFKCRANVLRRLTFELTGPLRWDGLARAGENVPRTARPGQDSPPLGVRWLSEGLGPTGADRDIARFLPLAEDPLGSRGRFMRFRSLLDTSEMIYPWPRTAYKPKI
jgi:hypothetical protein